MTESEPLAAELREAEEELKSTLEQACSTNLSRADTGELIRVEEMLAIASEAAKKAISIRRRRRQDRPAPRRPAKPAEHREFHDESGVTWRVFAVHPAGTSTENSKLLGDFQAGWLAFESERGKRRLRPIPEQWGVLDEQGLCDLLGRAQDAPARRADDRRS